MNSCRRVLIFALFSLLTAAVVAENAPIAGLQPQARPLGAPLIQTFEPGPAWRAQALRGIGEPPSGLNFLQDQGAWYTPFNRPNLLGKYDIRRLHGDGRRD